MRERELGEEGARAIAQALDGLCDLVLRVSVLDAADRDQPFDVTGQILDPVVADAEPEVLRRDVLELVRFVEDRTADRRDHLTEPARSHGRVGAEQVMVDDHHV